MQLRDDISLPFAIVRAIPQTDVINVKNRRQFTSITQTLSNQAKQIEKRKVRWEDIYKTKH